MSIDARIKSQRSWRNLLRARLAAQPVDLDLLADKCEALPFERQGWGLAQVLHLFREDAAEGSGGTAARTAPEVMWIGLLADSGAYESAALALLPADGTYTFARLGDGTHLAQVVLPGGVGAYSRGAAALSLAIVAALLRATAREMVEHRYRA
ncbi:hypothetical protein [Novosphingobium huizhouense]|uniref:hypothetical protein n=1 Tax=Novosphingobium huizhouense TaxID=2866625 RepID=UPI001CD90A37|nr:hypothetical protein [Novosphingobium huizhouense]